MRYFAPIPLVATLAVALAFNVVSASVLTALLQRPFPYPDLSRLMLVRDARPTDGAHQGRAISAGDFFDLRTSVAGFASLAAYRGAPLVMASGGADPETIEAAAVTANFFSTLGITPVLGRTWADDADEPGHDRVVLLSRRLWQARFGADRAVVGREVTLNGRTAVIAGIVRDADCYPAGVDAWIPLLIASADRSDRTAQSLNGVARLAAAVSIDATRAQLESTARQLALRYPVTNQGRAFSLLPLRREQYEFTAPLFGLVQMSALLVLLLGILNVTTVLVARQLDRAEDFAIRSMLGASPVQLGGLILRDTAILTTSATAVGLAAAFPALSALRSSLPEGIARWVNGWSSMRVDGAALAMGGGLGVGITIVIGAVLAWNVPTAIAVAGSGRRLTRGGRAARRLIVGSEIALAASLLLCAFAVFQTLGRQLSSFAAFAPDRLLRFTVTAPAARYPDDSRVGAFHTRLIDALGGLPTIESVALIRNEPASNVPSPIVTFERRDAPPRTLAERPRADLQAVSTSTFDVLRLRIVAGRPFLSTDTADGARVAVISSGAARRFWPDRDPVGSLIEIGSNPALVRVVGVSDDVELNWYDGGPRPTIYVPDAQSPSRTTSVLVRTRVDPVAVAREIRATVAKLDPLEAIGGVEPLARSIADSLSPIRIIDELLLIGAAVSCLLAAVGVFGIMAHSVSQRRREFGVRLALGATSRSIAALVLRDAVVTGVAGLAAGLVAAAGVVRVAGALLVGLIAVGSTAVVAVGLCTIGIVVAAAVTPAARAARVDAGALLRL